MLRLSGALSFIGVLTLTLGALSRFLPSESPLGPLARIFDSLAPWMLGLALLAALCASLTGARRLGAGLVLLCLMAGAHLIQDHRATSLPLADVPPDLRVLFFNLRYQNTPRAHQVIAAVEAAQPDVVVFAEGDGIYPALPQLHARYQVLSDCPFGACQLVVATRLPTKRAWHLSLNPIWPNRYAVAELETASGKRFHLAGVHLVKPWMSGVAGPEIRRLAGQFDWLPGPVLAVGDFNATPWSRPVQKLLQNTGFKAVRRSPATWPSKAGAWGIPIDLALVHNGARITHIEPFGGDLGSNHRGILVDVALP